MKETFIVRSEWWDAISELKPLEQAVIFSNLFHWHANRENLINLNNLQVKLVWKMILPSLQRAVDAYDKRKETSAENGKKGGRPPKIDKPIENLNNLTEPNETLSVHNSVSVHVGVSETDSDVLLSKEPKFDFFKKMKELGFEEKYVDEFKIIRKSKKAVNSELALTKILNEIEKSGIEKNECLKIICEKQWKGFEAEWLNNLFSEKEKSSVQKEKEPELKIGRQTVSELENNYQIIRNALDGV